MGGRASIRLATPTELDTIVSIDDDACQLYDRAGLPVALAADHPFTIAERDSWRRSLERGATFLAVNDDLGPVGFAALLLVDGAPYLDQLSVRLSAMRRGFGRALLGRAIEWARDRGDALWLVTYDHLAWNRPFYEREGFAVVPAHAWGVEMTAVIDEQRRALPAPERRIVMRRQVRQPG